MKRWKHMDALMNCLRSYAYIGASNARGVFRPDSSLWRRASHVSAYMIVFPRGLPAWMSSYGDTTTYNNRTRVRMPRSFLEWTVARANGPMKPFNYILTEGDRCDLEQAGFINLPE